MNGTFGYIPIMLQALIQLSTKLLTPLEVNSSRMGVHVLGQFHDNYLMALTYRMNYLAHGGH